MKLKGIDGVIYELPETIHRKAVKKAEEEQIPFSEAVQRIYEQIYERGES